MTQNSSRARVKHDGIGEDKMKYVFESYASMPVEDFRLLCIQTIEESAGKTETKIRFTGLIKQVNSKATMMSKVTNYFLAGEGKKV